MKFQIFVLAIFFLFIGCGKDSRSRSDEFERGIPNYPHYYGDTVNFYMNWGSEGSLAPQRGAILWYPGYVCVGQTRIVDGKDDGGESKIMVTLVWSNQYPKVLK